MALDPKLKDAVNYLNSHAHQAQAVIDLCAAVGDIATLEQLATEAEGRRHAALDDLDTQINARNSTLKELQGKITSASREAERITASARKEADGILSAARTAAEAKTAEIMSAGKQELATLNASILEANAALSAARSAVSTIEAATQAGLEAARKETADLEARAEKARDFLSNLAKQG